jgi:flagellar protein FlaF
MSVAAYQKANQNTENPRQTEYRAFAILTRAMEEAEAEDQIAKIKATAKNRQLWFALQKDLISDGNALSKELKGQLLSIAIWVGRYSPLVMKGEASMDPLITVNKQIMEGLKGSISPQEANPSKVGNPVDNKL